MITFELIPKTGFGSGIGTRLSRLSLSRKVGRRVPLKEVSHLLILICASSALSTNLDYDEVKFLKEVAEGAFGRVYKGKKKNVNYWS